METIANIRLLYYNQKKNVSEIARTVRMSRNTVREYLTYNEDVPKYSRQPKPKPQLGPHEAILPKWVETEAHLPRKQRRTARRLFDGPAQGGVCRSLRQRAALGEGVEGRGSSWCDVPRKNRDIIPSYFRVKNGTRPPLFSEERAPQ